MADKTVKKTGFMAKVKGFFARIAKYLRDTKSELKKVVWPSKEKSIRSTAVVLVTVIVAAIVMILLDLLFSGIVKLLIGV